MVGAVVVAMKIEIAGVVVIVAMMETLVVVEVEIA